MTKVMGILNLTPDSFFLDSRMNGAEAIRARALQIVAEGAEMIDVGACSTRPGSVFASQEEELRRLEEGMPFVREVCPNIPLSVDTFRASVAEVCVKKWGVSVINDISGGCNEIYRTAEKLGASYILTYNRQVEGDIEDDMFSFFKEKIREIHSCGVKEIILDPGFGFNKTLQQNYRLMTCIGKLRQELELPVLVGISRKSMIFRLLGITPAESLNGTSVLDAIAVQQNADWIRVHDVKEAVQTVRIVNAVNGFIE